jgi:hypothetical protein
MTSRVALYRPVGPEELAFDVDADFLAELPVQEAGGRDHTEYWIPADRLDDFNRHIIGLIKVRAEFRG